MTENYTAAPPARRQDWIFAWALLALTAVVFWPVIRWLTTETFAREQLKQSCFIVLIAGAWIAFEKRRTLNLEPRISNAVLAWLFTSHALALSALFFKMPLLVLAGLVVAVGGFVNYLFGGRAFRRTLPLLSVFALLVLCVLLFPVLDWPLRQMAGVEAGRFLKFLGLAPQLGILLHPEPRLILQAGGNSFVVATECNGFGLITSSLLLGLIRLLYVRAPWWRLGWLLPLCVAVGFVFNFLRISIIVLLAPRFPDHYPVLHEIAGLVALYSGLGLVWLLTGRERGAEKIR